MAAVNKLRVYVAVPEVNSQAAQTGAKASLTLDEFPGEVSLALPNTDLSFQSITGLPGEPAEKLAFILRALAAEGSNQ